MVTCSYIGRLFEVYRSMYDESHKHWSANSVTCLKIVKEGINKGKLRDKWKSTILWNSEVFPYFGYSVSCVERQFLTIRRWFSRDTILGIIKSDNPQSWLSKPSPVNNKAVLSIHESKTANFENGGIKGKLRDKWKSTILWNSEVFPYFGYSIPCVERQFLTIRRWFSRDTILLGIMKIDNPQGWLSKPSPVNSKVSLNIHESKTTNFDNALSVEINSVHKDGLSGSFSSSFVIDEECNACDNPQKTGISICTCDSGIYSKSIKSLDANDVRVPVNSALVIPKAYSGHEHGSTRWEPRNSSCRNLSSASPAFESHPRHVCEEVFHPFTDPTLTVFVQGHTLCTFKENHVITYPIVNPDKVRFYENVLIKQKTSIVRGENNNGSSSSSNESDDDNSEGDDRGEINTNTLPSHHVNTSLQHSLPTHKPPPAVHSGFSSLLPGGATFSSNRTDRIREAKVPPLQHVAITPNLSTKSPGAGIYTTTTDLNLTDGYNERGPILLDIPNGRNELVMAAHSTQEVPKLYPIVGLRKEMPGIALPPPIPLDLPKTGGNKKTRNVTIQHLGGQQHERLQQGAVPETVPVDRRQTSVNQITSPQQQFLDHHNNLPLDFSDPQSIISRASQFLHAGDYGMMMKILEVLDKHLVLSEEIEMAREFGQGLANYKKYQYRIAKTFFESLLEISIKHQSPGNHALASIYLGEVELYWGKHEEAVKHFTTAANEYHTDTVAELFQLTILTKSAVLVKKGLCHRAMSQIREAISAFKTAKQEAEMQQQINRTGEKLKAAKEDELSAQCALGNILQSIGDYDQSFEYYSDSLKLSKELKDHVSEGWAHGNLGNALLGLDQKDKALDHLTTAYNMSAKYECNPLAVGRAVSNLGNAFQAMGSLQKAKEHYETALGHAIYGSDLQGQGRACGNIGNICMLLKEPVKAVHYYTETLRLSTDRSTKVTGYHNRGCARYDVAELIRQGKKPEELVPATTTDSVYKTLSIKLTDEVITTHPVQETQSDRDPSARSVSEREEQSVPISAMPQPVTVNGRSLDYMTSEEINRLKEALPFYETARADLLEAIDAHEQSVQNVKGSNEALSLSLSLFESNSRSFYKIQETLVELGKVYHRLSDLGVMDMVSAEPQEFKQALVYAEQARARTLGELVLQKKKASYPDLFTVSTPLVLQDIYRAVQKQRIPVIFLSYCVSKLLMWILVPIRDEVKMKCYTIELKEEDFEDSSFELYIRYNLLQFLNQNEVYIFQRCAYEQESPFTVLYDSIAKKMMEGFQGLGASGISEFVVIPDSVTHLLPFSPLMNKDGWEFFGDRFRIKIVPSVLSLLVMNVTSDPIVELPGDKSDFLVVGNPTIPSFVHDTVQWNLGRLPFAEKEAVNVASILGTTPVLREQATKQSILYRLRSAKIIHLATHGSASAGFLAFTSSFPIPKSGIAETEHILIFPNEVETLNISPALVVLSSCDSGRGQVKAEGVIGMARAFLSAGAHSVLVSLWRVPDESANIFMQYFYQFLVNGLPSFQALQRSMQCMRCFHKYSHFVHWSGFHIIGKEITLQKNTSAQFPIEGLLGEATVFPRPIVKSIEESLLSMKTRNLSDVQLLVGTPGNEPEECARDFIKRYYQYYPCGVYWYDVSNELILETCLKVATEAPLEGGVYKEQKEHVDILPTATAPTLLTAKNTKPPSREHKKLIVLHNFTNLETCGCIMKQLQEASTDIIIVSNEFLFKDDIVTGIDKNLTRGCNLIDVTNLQAMSIIQRMVYGLLEKDSFSIRDADHIVFTLLSEYSRGAATIVHMLTSLMKKCDDNRTGFQLAKHQLKLHIGHKKYEKAIQKSRGCSFSASKAMRGINVVTESKELQEVKSFPTDSVSTVNTATVEHMSNEKESAGQDCIGVALDRSSHSEALTDELPSGRKAAQTITGEYLKTDMPTVPTDNEDQVEILPLTRSHTEIADPTKAVQINSERYVIDKGGKSNIVTSVVKKMISYVIGSDDKQKSVSEATQIPEELPATESDEYHSDEENVCSTLYMYINDILKSPDFSLPAQHLLHCLSIVGPVPLPKFYIDELDKLITEAITTKEDRRMQKVRGFIPDPLISQLEQGGVIRKYPNPLVYHKDFNPQNVDPTIQLMFIPKLICDAIDSEMDTTDKAVSIMCVQHALDNILTGKNTLSMIHFHYIMVLCNELFDICISEYPILGDTYITESIKLKLRIAKCCENVHLS
ncbi:uncharacterized protein [Dysidea avara]